MRARASRCVLPEFLTAIALAKAVRPPLLRIWLQTAYAKGSAVKKISERLGAPEIFFIFAVPLNICLLRP